MKRYVIYALAFALGMLCVAALRPFWQPVTPPLTVPPPPVSMAPSIETPTPLATLLAEMKQPETLRRQAAMAELARQRDPEAFEPLVVLLLEGKDAVRRDAALALGSLRDARAIPVLIAAFNEPDPALLRVLPQALAAVPELALDQLVAALGHEDFPVRRGAAAALAAIASHAYPESAQQKAAQAAADCMAAGLQRNNLELLAGGYAYYIVKGQSAALPRLTKALELLGDLHMAEVFQYCGQPELAEAARKWSADNQTPLAGQVPVDAPRWNKQ